MSNNASLPTLAFLADYSKDIIEDSDVRFVLRSLVAHIAAQDARIHALELRAGLVVPEALPSAEDECDICGGIGELECRLCESGKRINSWGDTVDCDMCDGHGRRDCRQCKGTGKLEVEALASVEDYPTIHMPIETIRVEVTCAIINAPAQAHDAPIYGPCNQCFKPTDLIAVGDGYFCADCLNKNNPDGTRREDSK